MSSIVNYVADGSTTEFQIPFTYISEAHVVVTIDGTATSAFTFLNSSTLQMNTAPTAGAKVQLQRVTPTGALVDFTDGSTLFETDLDLAHQQNRLIAEESKDIANVAKTTIDNNIADVNTVAGIAADVSNVSSRGADVTSVADNMAEVLLADTNAATATTKAAEAVVSANTASAQAAISTTKAGESSASAAAALASQNAAQQARTDTDASEALALAYKNSAQTSASTATTKASEASQSATTASSQAAVATTKSTEASTDAGIALAQAAVATTKAAEASTSESNALSYRDTALAASAASETARAASVVAKDASQVAKTASEAARDAAAASQTAAATSETNAAASEGVATTQAGISTTKAGEASTSASNAASSAASAQASKDAALEALDSFDDRYLGQKVADPTVDNDGNTLVAGALYFNTTDDIMKVYDGSQWVAAYASLSGAMFGANNLSDVADAAASRTNLGLVIGTNVQAFSAILANTTASYTTAEETKLAGIEANAKDDQTITAGSGLTGGGTGDVTLSHADTSSVGNSDNSGNTFIQDINFDTYGHVTSVGTGTVSVGNGTLTVQGTGALGGSGTFSANQSGNTTISISHDDTSSQGSVNNSGATVIQDVTLDGYGHITNLASKTLTLADLGGSASADSIQTLSSQPATRSEGDIYYNTTEGQLYVGTSTDWEGLLNLAPETTGGTVTISTVNHGTSVSYNFGADFTDRNYTDNSLTYTLDSGTLPSGTSLSGQNLTGAAVGGNTATTYTFSITATNPAGLANTQAYQMTVNAVPNNTSNGEAIFTSNATWTVPAGVYNVCAVCVGAGGAGQGNYGGGGGGGALAWANQIVVNPGETYSIVVGQGAANAAGGDSYINFGSQGIVRANGGESTSAQVTYANGGQTANTIANSGGGYGGIGGRGRAPNPYHVAGGGGGAGGYSGAGGNGSAYGLDTGTNGSGGGGGGGGNRYSDPGCGYTWATGGGGVGLNGEGSNGYANQSNTYACTNNGTAYGGGGGSGGANASNSTSGGTAGGAYGGGGGAGWSNGGARGGHGAVRIVWKTASKGNYGFPSTNVS